MSHTTSFRPLLALLGIVGLLSAVGCRGGISEKPPVHLVLDMDFQAKVKAQSAVDFESWTDGRGMRLPPTGTVARGSLTDEPLDVWKDDGNNYLSNQVPASMETLRRGQERFDIYCAVCHDRSGSGKGLALQRANPGAFNPSVPHLGTEPRLREQADGYFYEVIRNGFGTMPAYGHQIRAQDRWAIVHYVRALQDHFE